MILLNKALPNQRLVVTASEKNITPSFTLKLKVENKQSNRNYELILPDNTSVFQSRYDEFIFPTTSISSWITGTYIYNIVEVDGSVANILEIGLLKVIDVEVEQFLSVEEVDTADDFIVYSNI